MLLKTFEHLLNRGLARSVRARELAAGLAGRSLAIEAPDIARVRLASDGRLLSLEASAAPADATLRGGPLSLAGLLGEGARALLQQGGVTLEGDTEVAQQFQELLQLCRPDPEEELSLIAGDVGAHGLARLANAGLEFARRAATTGLRNTAEYLAHERADLVSRAEGEQFLRGVDAVREGVDRAAARLDILARRRTAP